MTPSYLTREECIPAGVVYTPADLLRERAMARHLDIVANTDEHLGVRGAAWQAYCEAHAQRPPEFVAELERARGLR